MQNFRFSMRLEHVAYSVPFLGICAYKCIKSWDNCKGLKLQKLITLEVEA